MPPKKTAAKKKSAKKKDTRKPKSIVIWLDPRKGVVKPSVVVRRGCQDSVKWKNRDDKAHTLKFSAWPFGGHKAKIKVRAKSGTRLYKVRRDARKRGYSYKVVPPLPTGPPNPPDIVVTG